MEPKHALVTGSGKRIGKAFVKYLASMGYDVALHYFHSYDDAHNLAIDLRKTYTNRQFPLVKHDLGDWQNVENIFLQLPSTFSKLSLLINNASIYEQQTLSDSDAFAIDRNFAIHCFAPLLLMQSFAKRCTRGLVVNMLDTKIKGNELSFAPYLLSKKSLADLTLMAAKEWAPHIRVNGIAPGPVLPAIGRNPDLFQQVVAQTPLKEAVDINSILNMLQFFIDNQHVTGQIIYVDSGSHL
jgi:NAD(P)-dependent dehydrogenase (short-subunit alcohol dehydrogenase family)